ncbi:MAG TPA: GyrI-like domain-containing protein [Streptosporangiaceae bacterium]|nr:GyrI-like domain-containing protein [Streptosporangiaceae bacterium]
MSNEPQIQERTAQHYAGIPVTVTMDGLSAAVDSTFSELFPWLASQGIPPAGAPLIRYLVIDMAGEMQIEMGVPVAAPTTASGRIQPGTLPGGRYAVLRHTGPYDGLVASNAALERWAQEHGIEFDTWNTPQGSAWRGRAEHYLTDPSQEPDPAKLETDVAYLIA